jgi:hypothetical protein
VTGLWRTRLVDAASDPATTVIDAALTLTVPDVTTAAGSDPDIGLGPAKPANTFRSSDLPGEPEPEHHGSGESAGAC